ncbi:MAG: hypothetical protein Q4P66_04920 [Actinomycetaceae bacterium]|nr:hypothetical protein [Actinomycetaceae bacterium]MDO5746984.1 hypothetical protein [Actinomycetaceae bacterium]
MTTPAFRRRPMIQKLSRVDKQRQRSKDCGASSCDASAKKTVEHRVRLKKRHNDAELSPEDRRLLEELPPHWYGRNQ